jgi:hypothetical protein
MEPNTPTEPARRWDFSGREEIYDDGLVRLSLPAEFQLVESDDPDDRAFLIADLPAKITWTTLLLDEEAAERLGTPCGDVEGGQADASNGGKRGGGSCNHESPKMSQAIGIDTMPPPAQFILLCSDVLSVRGNQFPRPAEQSAFP